MLENEAEIYASFPDALQECNPSSPPIVPRFYGHYWPSFGSAYRYNVGEDKKKVQRDAQKFLSYLSPIMLVEFCGRPIKSENLSSSDWCEDFSPKGWR